MGDDGITHYVGDACRGGHKAEGFPPDKVESLSFDEALSKLQKAEIEVERLKQQVQTLQRAGRQSIDFWKAEGATRVAQLETEVAEFKIRCDSLRDFRDSYSQQAAKLFRQVQSLERALRLQGQRNESGDWHLFECINKGDGECIGRCVTARAALVSEQRAHRRALGTFSHTGYEEELQADHSPNLGSEPAGEPKCPECGGSGEQTRIHIAPGSTSEVISACPSCQKKDE